MTDTGLNWEPLDNLTPWAHNPRNNKKAIKEVAASIKRFGFAAPIVANRRDGTVIAGHTRLEAARSLKLTEVPVRWLDLDPAEAHALALADNRLGEIATWDDAKLAEVLAELRANDDTILAATGFSDDDLQRLGFGAKNIDRNEPDTDDDANDPLPGPASSQLGATYHLGPHRLFCGDSTKAATWDALFGKDRAEMVWTDPPFGVSYVGKTKDNLTIENDQLDEQALQHMLQQALERAFAYTAPGGAWYIKAPAGPIFLAFAKVMAGLGVWRQTLVWAKSCMVLGRSDFHYRHEAIFYGWHPGAAHRWRGDRKQDTILQFDKPARNPDHPTMTPPDLISYCLQQSSQAGDLVADCFGGSGSTMIAADQCGRVARLIEIDPRYCDVIRRRWWRYATANGLPVGDGLEP